MPHPPVAKGEVSKKDAQDDMKMIQNIIFFNNIILIFFKNYNSCYIFKFTILNIE